VSAATWLLLATLGARSAPAELALSAVAQEPVRDVRAEWTPVWLRLAEYLRLPRQDPEHASLRRELIELAARREDAARKRSDRPMAFRARLLAAALARADGLDERRVADPGVPFEFLPGEAELAAEFALPGPLRTRALLLALDEAEPAARGPAIERARRTAREALGAGRGDEAEFVARGLLARDAGFEHALFCAEVLRRTGRYEEAGGLLVDAEPATLEPGPEAPGALARRAQWAEQRARLEFARGRPEAGLDALGTALAAGSVAARRELAARASSDGDRARALALTRAFLDDGAEDRALWARCLLPGRAPESTPPRNPPREHP